MFAEVTQGSDAVADRSFWHRVRVLNLALPQNLLAQGRPVLLVASHQGNWEWVLQALALQLGYPLDVGYKPIKSPWVEAALDAIRRRFGAHLVPAKDLLPDLLQRRHIVRGIAMLADQAPTTSDHKHWLTFLGATRRSTWGRSRWRAPHATRQCSWRCVAPRAGATKSSFQQLADAGEQLPPGEFTNRYAQLVETGNPRRTHRLDLGTPQLEAQTRRSELKRGIVGKLHERSCLNEHGPEPVWQTGALRAPRPWGDRTAR